MYEYLRSRIRGANDYPKQIKSSSNPGNVGHQFFKSRFIDVCPPMKTYEVKNPRTGKTSTRLFIPSKVTDNKFLMEADPDYINRLEDLPEEERKALLDGSWDLYEGQFFPEFNRNVHVIPEIPMEKDPETGKLRYPKDWRMYQVMDYGLDMLASYFVAVDNHERGYVFGEIYEPNVIISDAAKMIKEKQKALGIVKVDEYLAPSDLWSRQRETGKSMADIFLENGIRLHKVSRDRLDGWACTKEWLKPFKDEQGIMTAKIRIHESCVNLIRCVPAVQHDPHRPGDISTEPHEISHSTDALRYFCTYRTRANREMQRMTEAEIRAEREYDEYTSASVYDVYKNDKEEQYSGSSDDDGGYSSLYQ